MAGKSDLNGINAELQSVGDEDIDAVSNMYLTFKLGAEDYGIGISYVTEIVGMQNITEIPDMPDYVRGVVNLRGIVIPVIDVRLRFHMEAREYDARTCIVVINIKQVQMGLIVDTVNEVRTIDQSMISPPPHVATAQSARYIKGLGKVGDQVKILLDARKLLFAEELETITTAVL